jgi:hypothetical protein
MTTLDKTENSLLAITDNFLSRISYTSIEKVTFGIADLQNTKRSLQPWNNKAGIYYFVQGNEVKYVGRATPNVGLGARVYQQVNAFGGSDGWDDIINDGTVRCGLIVFHDNDDWHWLTALEVLLIDKLRPQFNKRF